MSRFTVYAFNALSGARIGEVAFTDVSWSSGLNATGQGSVTMPWYQELADVITPGRDGLAIDDRGTLLWSGWVRAREVSPDSGTVRFGLDSWWAYYANRTIRSRTGMTYPATSNVGPLDVVFTSVDQFRIVSDLLAHAASIAGGGNLGLTVRMFGPGSGGISGVTRTRTYYGYERKKIAQSVQELSAQTGGFDFTVDTEWNTGTSPYQVTRYLDLYYPRRGASTSTPTLEHGSNVQMLRVSDDATILANPVTAVGAGQGDAALTAEAIDSASIYPAGEYPYIEDEARYRDEGAEYSGNLARLADSRLAATRRPLRTAEAECTESADLQLGSVGIGDSLRVVAEFGPYSIDEQMRVLTEAISLDAGGLRSWKFSLTDDDASLGII